MRRLWKLFGSLVAGFSLVAAAPPASYPAADRVVAIGDLHGDFEAWRTIAQAARLIDRRGRWTGGKGVLVQTGDVADRGPDSLKIIRDLMRLQRESRRRGGRVIMLVGNHEAMNVTGDLRYVHPGEFAIFADGQSARRRDIVYAANRTVVEAAYRARDPKLTAEAIKARWISDFPLGKLEHQRAWAPTGEIGAWIIANPVVVKIGESLFVHGGLSASYAMRSLDQINQAAAIALKAQDEAETSIINDQMGPLWYRGLASAGSETSASVAQELTQLLQAHGAKRMVIGHTPDLSGIKITHGGRVVRIDTGNSRHYAGALSYLEIRSGGISPVTVQPAGARGKPTP